MVFGAGSQSASNQRMVSVQRYRPQHPEECCTPPTLVTRGPCSGKWTSTWTFRRTTIRWLTATTFLQIHLTTMTAAAVKQFASATITRALMHKKLSGSPMQEVS